MLWDGSMDPRAAGFKRKTQPFQRCGLLKTPSMLAEGHLPDQTHLSFFLSFCVCVLQWFGVGGQGATATARHTPLAACASAFLHCRTLGSIPGKPPIQHCTDSERLSYGMAATSELEQNLRIVRCFEHGCAWKSRV